MQMLKLTPEAARKLGEALLEIEETQFGCPLLKVVISGEDCPSNDVLLGGVHVALEYKARYVGEDNDP